MEHFYISDHENIELEEVKYKKQIKSNKNHLFTLEIKFQINTLLLISYFTENYITHNYIGKFYLEVLQRISNYYKQFNSVEMIIKEIEAYNGEEKISLEEKNDEVDIKFPIGSATFKEINFTLKLKHKSDKEKIEEYEMALKKYKEHFEGWDVYIKKLTKKINHLENRFLMPGLNSKILLQDNYQKEIIKMWISPFKDISAHLIYCFNFKYKKPLEDYENGYDDLKNFHKSCDGKSNVLVLCKSKDEIFGGFTPLCFLSDNTYGYDNDSFIFSVNNLKKYSKYNLNNDKSIWRYADYGPCFSYDMNFKINTINQVKFECANYCIPKSLVDKNNAIIDCDNWILLDSIEIYQIIFPS